MQALRRFTAKCEICYRRAGPRRQPQIRHHSNRSIFQHRLIVALTVLSGKCGAASSNSGISAAVKVKPAHLAAWLLLAATAFVTLAPASWRPETGFSAQIERFVTFALIGLVFSIAYPRRPWLIALMVLGAAVTFEALQLLVETRHAGLRDVIAKLAGGSVGLLAGRVIVLVRRRYSSTDSDG
jgi:VanZ family protein